MTIRIAHIVWTLSIGGIQTMLVDIANEQVKTQKVAIYVVNNCVDPELANKLDQRILLFCSKRRPGSKSPISILKLNWALYSFHPDIIHCHEDRLTSLLFWEKTHLIRTIHNTHSCPKEFNKYSRLCCISQAVKNYTASQGFSKSLVVYNGIHIEQIPSRSYIYGYNNGTKHIISVGRLHPMKGHRVLLEAAKELVNVKNRKDLVIDIIGDGELRNELETTTKQFGLENNVRFLGLMSRDNIYPLLKTYDLYVLPSVSEGFGLTLAEACAAKIPVITCDLPGPMEVIANGRYGHFFITGDSHSLANEIEKLLQKEVDNKRIEEAWKYVKEHFDIAVTSQKYIEVYKEVIEESQ